MKSIYLDYAAATPLDKDVLEAMTPYFASRFHNPGATYLAARRVKQDLEMARASIARAMGVRPAEVIFTSGATESNNMVIAGVAKRYPEAKVLVSQIEHESVLAPARQVKAEFIPVDGSGTVDLDWLARHIDDTTVLISVMLVSNELGTIQPLKKIGQLITEVRKQRLASGNRLPLYMHTDAAQAPNYLDLQASGLGVDMMSINGAKIYGPKGIGVLYIRKGVRLEPLLYGGGQESGLRSGTENVPLVIGLASALQKTVARRVAESKRLTGLKIGLERSILADHPGTFINGGQRRAPHISSITFPGVDNERLMIQLDEAGIECATGSACSAIGTEPSHVLQAIGLSPEASRSTLRFSLGNFTAQSDIERLTTALGRLVGQQ